MTKAGFALPAVLAITGVVCLALLAAVTAVDSLARSAREARDRSAFEETALSVEARTTLSALTLPVTTDSILVPDGRGQTAPLLLDGAPYAASGLEVSLQDEAGLINLDTLPSRTLPRLVEQFGVEPRLAPALAARLADFLDPDDLVRAGGAERDAYRAAGRPPPPNGPLRGRAELLGVLGWEEAAPKGSWRAVRSLVVTDSVNVGVNINTTPATVLQVLYGLTPDQAERAVARRRIAPFATLEDLGRAAGVALVGDAERSVIRPSNRLQFGAASARARQAYASRLVLTPDDPSRPFHVEDRAIALLPAEKAGQSPRHVAPLPVPRD